MSKALHVAWFEFYTTITRRSVLFVMFGLPLITIAVVTLVNRLATPGPGNPGAPGGVANATSLLSDILLGRDESLPSGLVDEAGLLSDAPLNDIFIAFGSRAEAAAAYERGELLNFYVIPAEYPDSREIAHHAPGLNYPRRDHEQFILYQALALALLPSHELAGRVIQPARISETDLSPPEGVGGAVPGGPASGGPFAGQFVVGFGIAMLFFATTMGASGYLLQSLGREKQNRVIEVLLSSVHARELLVGKVVGLGAMGFVQLLVWSVVVLLIVGRGSGLFGNLPLPELALGQWLLVALFFVAGYFVYAALYAGLGALSPNPKEGSQYAFLIVLPVLVPLWFINIFWTAPNSAPAVILSLFPLSAPLAMPLRLLATGVPPAQVAGSLALIIVTAAGIIIVIARLFRGQVLVSGQTLSLRGMLRAVRGAIFD